jgi:hypothetical protein
MRGKSALPTWLQAVAGTHWSEDTLGLPPEHLARCVLPPHSSKAVSRVNFPLSTYSVFGGKNVSGTNENIFGHSGQSDVLSLGEDKDCYGLVAYGTNLG